MRLTRTSILPDVALAVGEQLVRHGIRAVLAGGACVAIDTGTDTSNDADFVQQGLVTERALDDAMRELGFERSRDRYVHPEVEFFVEFPLVSLSIDEELTSSRCCSRSQNLLPLARSATDSCGDRLAVTPATSAKRTRV